MRNNRVWERACGLKRTVVEGVRYDESAGAIIDGLGLNGVGIGFEGTEPVWKVWPAVAWL